jgi:hypothetical protein
VSGCIVDRSPLDLGRDAGPPVLAIDTGTTGVDAFVEPPDAYVPPGIDAFVAPPDAFVAPPDAFVAPPDAFVAPPDAFVAPDARPVCVPTPEVCNGRDDDCNGTVDDGACGATVMSGAFVTCEARGRGSSAYLVCDFFARWDQARAVCRSFASAYDLVAFADGAEQDAVRAWLPGNAWIGLTDSPSRVPGASDENYRWVDGTAPTFRAWGPGEPASDRADGCVILSTDGLWDAASCDFETFRRVVCELTVTP